ncbi:MAG: chemotaxis protein CheW [Pseudomonadota bacterium]
MEHVSQTQPDRAGKYLTFKLASEGYGIPILTVKEIIGLMPFTPIPRAPEFIKGVINLRGKVIPVIDLRMKFGIPPKDYDERTCIVVVEVETGQGRYVMGLIVDAVDEVTNVHAEDTEDAPNFGIDLDTRFIKAIAKTAGGVKILLDIARVLSEEEFISLN